jgi:type I restriction enzyme, S subunit
MVADGYKDTELGAIPIEWEVSKLNDILTIGSGKDYKHLEKGNIPVYGTGGFMLSVNKCLYNGESACIGRKGTIDKPMFLTGKFWTVDTLFYTHLFKGVTPKFVYYSFLKIDWKRYNEASGVPSLSKRTIEVIEIPLPPLKEQEKIADILSTADDKIDTIATQIEKAETLKKGLLQKLLSEGIGHSEFKDSELGKIPESWEIVELEKLLTFKNGVNASKEQYGKGYRFINVLDIINNLTIKHDDIIGLVDIDEKEFELYEVKYGDILFQRSSETREEVGQSNVYLDKEQSATFGGFVIKGSAKQEYNPVFMNYLFKIPIIRKQITSKSGGSTRYNIGQSSLNQVLVQFPPLEEQKQIADILSTADGKLELLRARKEKYETLKKGLLQKLLSGEVRV